MFGFQIARGLVARRMPLMAQTAIASKSPASLFVSRLPLLNSSSPLKRAFGSASSDHHHENHGDAPTKYARPGEGSLQLWMIGSAMLFLPILFSLTEKEEDVASHHAKAAHDPVSIKEENTSGSHDNDVPVSKKSEASKSPAVPVASANISRVVPHVTYVLVGAGTASFAAMKAIKEREPDADILIIGDEQYVPYQRPPLSKELWHSDQTDQLVFKDFMGGKRSLFYEGEHAYDIVTPDLFESLATPSPSKVRVLKGVKVESLDPESETLLLSTGRQIKYSKVLLATGGSPKRIPVADQLPEDVQSKVLTFRSLDDFKHLSELQAQGGKIIAIVGGGFLGSELAAALAQKGASNGNRIVQLFPEDGNMGLVFPRYLTKWTTTQLRNEGVDIKTNAQLTSMVKAGDKIELHATGIEPIEADYVVLAVGLSPNVEIAQASGLELDEKRGGILVNAELEARSNVFAAGDCTSFHDITLGRRRRVEHYDHAVMSGQLAGLNMTGAKKPYTHLSMFWSDLGPKVAYEAVGIIDSSLQTVGVWAQGKNHPRTEDTEDEYNKGIVYYLNKDKKLVGVLLFNTFGEVDAARELLKQGTTYQDISKFQTALVSMV